MFYKTKEFKNLVEDLYEYSREKLGFDKSANVHFKIDSQNSKQFLGRTAYYDPSSHKIAVYVKDRHPKDVLRSLSHELVHHAQNCRGDFAANTVAGEGYAQNDPHLREMEREAYECGNLIFRDWEDMRKNELQETIYYDNGRKLIMSSKSLDDVNLDELVQKKYGSIEEELHATTTWHAGYHTSESTSEDIAEEEGLEEDEVKGAKEHPMSVASKEKHKPSEKLEESEEITLQENQTVEEWYNSNLFDMLKNRWTK